MGGTLFIATQMPFPDTNIDFYRMIYDYKCKTIIMLNTIDPNDKVCTRFCDKGSVTVLNKIGQNVI